MLNITYNIQYTIYHTTHNVQYTQYKLQHINTIQTKQNIIQTTHDNVHTPAYKISNTNCNRQVINYKL